MAFQANAELSRICNQLWEEDHPNRAEAGRDYEIDLQGGNDFVFRKPLGNAYCIINSLNCKANLNTQNTWQDKMHYLVSIKTFWATDFLMPDI